DRALAIYGDLAARSGREARTAPPVARRRRSQFVICWRGLASGPAGASMGKFRRASPEARTVPLSASPRRAMKIKTALIASGLLPALPLRAPAATFRFAFQGDLKSLDPYSLNEGFTLGMLGNVYEGLTKRDKNLAITPGLAERWEVLEPMRWRFYLRKGVKFQNGEDFTAGDVAFFPGRGRADGFELQKHQP